MNTTQTWVSWIENGKPTAEIGSVLLALTTLGVEMNFVPPPAPSSDGDDQPRDLFPEPEEDTAPYRL